MPDELYRTPPGYDVVIVGAGAAGSMLAYKLTHAQPNKLSVLILEAGPEFGSLEDRVDAFYAAAAKTPSAPWPDSPQARRPTVLDIVSKDTWQSDDKYLRQKGPLPFSSTYERLSGGTANHWVGTTLRLLPEDFKLNSGLGVEGARDWPIGYQDLAKYYDEAESEIGVSGNSEEWKSIYPAGFTQFPMPEIPQTYLDQHFKKNVDGKQINNQAIRITSTPQARNRTWYRGRPPCVGNNSCTPLCPTRAKYDPSHHLKSVLGQVQHPSYPNEPNGHGHYPAPAPNPGEIHYRSVAYRLDVDKSSGNITGVRYRTWDKNEHVATARIYVICAHAIETAKLLLNSPCTMPDGLQTTVANRSGQVGSNLMDHPILLMWALTKEPVYPFRGPISTSGIGSFRFGEARKRRAAYILEIGNDGWRWPTGAPLRTIFNLVHGGGSGEWFGSNLLAAMRDHGTRQVRMAAEFEDLPSANSRVTLSRTHKDQLGIPQPEIHYELSEYTQRGFDDAVVTLRGIFEALGTTEIHYEPAEGSKSPGLFRSPGGNRFELRGAGHIMGTHRMGSSPEDSVVDGDCRSWDHTNLFLVGGGVFPSAGTANPTLTIFALALRAAETILNDLKAQVS